VTRATAQQQSNGYNEAHECGSGAQLHDLPPNFFVLDLHRWPGKWPRRARVSQIVGGCTPLPSHARQRRGVNSSIRTYTTRHRTGTGPYRVGATQLTLLQFTCKLSSCLSGNLCLLVSHKLRCRRGWQMKELGSLQESLPLLIVQGFELNGASCKDLSHRKVTCRDAQL
jgi:hypothetical protein